MSPAGDHQSVGSLETGRSIVAVQHDTRLGHDNGASQDWTSIVFTLRARSAKRSNAFSCCVENRLSSSQEAVFIRSPAHVFAEQRGYSVRLAPRTSVISAAYRLLRSLATTREGCGMCRKETKMKYACLRNASSLTRNGNFVTVRKLQRRQS